MSLQSLSELLDSENRRGSRTSSELRFFKIKFLFSRIFLETIKTGKSSHFKIVEKVEVSERAPDWSIRGKCVDGAREPYSSEDKGRLSKCSKDGNSSECFNLNKKWKAKLNK